MVHRYVVSYLLYAACPRGIAVGLSPPGAGGACSVLRAREQSCWDQRGWLHSLASTAEGVGGGGGGVGDVTILALGFMYS